MSQKRRQELLVFDRCTKLPHRETLVLISSEASQSKYKKMIEEPSSRFDSEQEPLF